MAWITPKTNWTPADGVGAADLNRIENNIDYLNNRRQQNEGTITSQGQSINDLYATRVQSRVNSGKFEFWDGAAYKQIDVAKSAYAWVNPVTGNDALTTSTSSAPYRTIGRAMQDMPKFCTGERVIYLGGVSGQSYQFNEMVSISGFVGGQFRMIPMSSDIQINKGVIIQGNQGVYFSFFNNGKLYDWRASQDTSSGIPYGLWYTGNYFCSAYFSGMYFTGQDRGTAVSCDGSTDIHFYASCRLNSWGSSLLYGFTITDCYGVKIDFNTYNTVTTTTGLLNEASLVFLLSNGIGQTVYKNTKGGLTQIGY